MGKYKVTTANETKNFSSATDAKQYHKKNGGIMKTEVKEYKNNIDTWNVYLNINKTKSENQLEDHRNKKGMFGLDENEE